MIGPSNLLTSTPSFSAICRGSPRYRNTDAGSATASLSPPAFPTASASEILQAPKAYWPWAPEGEVDSTPVPAVETVVPATAPNTRNVWGSAYKYKVSFG